MNIAHHEPESITLWLISIDAVCRDESIHKADKEGPWAHCKAEGSCKQCHEWSEAWQGGCWKHAAHAKRQSHLRQACVRLLHLLDACSWRVCVASVFCLHLEHVCTCLATTTNKECRILPNVPLCGAWTVPLLSSICLQIQFCQQGIDMCCTCHSAFSMCWHVLH